MSAYGRSPRRWKNRCSDRVIWLPVTAAKNLSCCLPGIDLEGALLVAKRVLESVSDQQIEHKTSTVSPYVSISMGAACMQPGPKRLGRRTGGPRRQGPLPLKRRGSQPRDRRPRSRPKTGLKRPSPHLKKAHLLAARRPHHHLVPQRFHVFRPDRHLALAPRQIDDVMGDRQPGNRSA